MGAGWGGGAVVDGSGVAHAWQDGDGEFQCVFGPPESRRRQPPTLTRPHCEQGGRGYGEVLLPAHALQSFFPRPLDFRWGRDGVGVLSSTDRASPTHGKIATANFSAYSGGRIAEAPTP